MRELYGFIFYSMRSIISKNGIKTKPETNAYYLISLFEGINMVSVYNLLKSINKSINDYELTLFVFVIIFFSPFFVFNYFFFIKDSRFKVLIREGDYKSKSSLNQLIIVGAYVIFTILFFGFSIWVNV